MNNIVKPGYKQTEVGVIPVNWNICAGADIGSGVDIVGAIHELPLRNMPNPGDGYE